MNADRPRIRCSRNRNNLILLLALLPACCAPKPPAPAPVATLPLPPPPPAPRPARPVLHATWSFDSDAESCTAIARAGATQLQIVVRPGGPIRLSLSLPMEPPARPVARFAGPAGRWLIAGAHAGRREAIFPLDHNEGGLSRILMLLSGGTFDLQPPEDDLPILLLPGSGHDGDRWFACARHHVI
jgi:hypothetical protein